MSFWTGELIVDDKDLLTAYTRLFQDYPEIVTVIINRGVNDVGDEYLKELQTEPGPVRLPITWASDKQRKAYFATKGFGHGIPYQRTHNFVRNWKLIVVYPPGGKPAEIYFRNDSPARRYITGAEQQPFHQRTGWYKEQEVFLDAAIALEDRIETGAIKAFYAVGA